MILKENCLSAKKFLVEQLIEHMSTSDLRFEHNQKQRYYRIILTKDLFGDWLVTRAWGGIGKLTGRVSHIACASYEDALLLIENISKIRVRKGYKLVK